MSMWALEQQREVDGLTIHGVRCIDNGKTLDAGDNNVFYLSLKGDMTINGLSRKLK